MSKILQYPVQTKKVTEIFSIKSKFLINQNINFKIRLNPGHFLVTFYVILYFELSLPVVSCGLFSYVYLEVMNVSEINQKQLIFKLNLRILKYLTKWFPIIDLEVDVESNGKIKAQCPKFESNSRDPIFSFHLGS